MHHSSDQECFSDLVFTKVQMTPEHNRSWGPIKKLHSPRNLEIILPSSDCHHMPIGENLILTICNMHSSLRLEFLKVSFGENSMKTPRFLSKLLCEKRGEGRPSFFSSLRHDCPGMSHPNQNPLESYLGSTTSTSKLSRTLLIQHLVRARASKRSFNSITVVAKSTRSTKSEVMMLTPMAPGF